LAALEALLGIRDTLAQQKDRPLFKIMSNAALLKISTTLPADLKQLKATNVLSAKQIDMYGQSITAAVQQAQQLPASQLPVYPRQRAQRLSPRIPPRVKALRAWRDELATQMELDPALLLNKALIRDIAIQQPKRVSQLREVPGIHQWQIDAFGEKIVDTLKNMP
jgi:ribonuclease D